MSFSEWISTVFSSAPLFCLVVLTLGVIFVNGWTDAPNAIASCVATRALSPKVAVLSAAVCNLFGLVLSVLWNRTVTDTVYAMVNLGEDRSLAHLTLCAAMVSVVLWALAAWVFGIPISESHALLAGITGAALALHGGDGVRFAVWGRVLWGLCFSVLCGFLGGFLAVRFILRLFFSVRRSVAQRCFRRLQIAGGLSNAFLHGAQDGQKFIGVLLLSVASLRGGEGADMIPWWMIFLCSAVLCCGTALGGGRIIRAVGMKMIRMERYQGVAADAASVLSLGICTLFGLPVSTTHVKTVAVMGTGAAVRIRSVHWGIAGQMALAWILTFPGCGLLGYGVARLFLLWF